MITGKGKHPSLGKLVRYLIVATILAWLCALTIGLFGHEMVQAIYEGRAFFLSDLISGQASNTLDAYQKLFDESFRFLLLAMVLVTVSLPFLLQLIRFDYSAKKYTRIDALLLSYLLLLFLFTTYAGWQGYVNDNIWRIGDWLINYQGGFVRRGFTGEIIYWLWKNTGVAPSIYAILVQTICYFVFFLFTGLLLRRQEKLLPYIILIVSPFIFTYQLHDVQGGYRKEIEYFALLSVYAWSFIATKPSTFKLISFAAFFLYPTLILSHEILAVFLPYLLVIYLLRETQDKWHTCAIAILPIASIAALLATLKFSGSANSAIAVCDSLREFLPENCAEQGAIAALSQDTDYGVRIVVSNISNNNYVSKYLICALLAAIAFVPVFDRFASLKHRPLVWTLLMISVLGTIPLFFVAVDWGRFMYIHLVSLFIISLCLPPSAMSMRSIQVPSVGIVAAASRPRSYLTWAWLIVFVVFLFAYATLWHIPHSGAREVLLDYFSWNS